MRGGHLISVLASSPNTTIRKRKKNKKKKKKKKRRKKRSRISGEQQNYTANFYNTLKRTLKVINTNRHQRHVKFVLVQKIASNTSKKDSNNESSD